MATAAHPTRDDFAALLNESLGGEDQGFEGRVVKGTVTAIENDHAVIDVGLKSEGRVPLREFAAPGQKAELAVGDTVEVYVDRVENVNGEAMLSRDRARRTQWGSQAMMHRLQPFVRAIVAVAAFGAAHLAAALPPRGSDAPPIALTALDGKAVNSADFANRPMVLLFGELNHDGVKRASAGRLSSS